MATVKQYALSLWRAHKVISRKLGADITWGPAEERVRALSSDIVLAGLVKILTDKGVITDGELTAVYTAIASADFPALPSVDPPANGDPAPDPDLGA